MFRRSFIFFFLILSLIGCQGQSSEELLAESEAQVALGNHRGALVLLKNALESDPEYHPARIALAKTYLALGNADIALQELEKAEALSPDPGDEHRFVKAEVKLYLRQPEQTLNLLSSLSPPWRTRSDVLSLQGQALAILSRFDRSEAALRHAIAVDADNRRARLTLCRVLDAQGKSVEYQQCLISYVAQWPKDREGVFLLARQHIVVDQAAQAIPVLESYLGEASVDPEIGYRLGTLYLQADRLNDATALAERIKGANPDHHLGYLLSGHILLVKELPQDALEQLSVATRVYRKNHGAQFPATDFYTGIARYLLDQKELALNHFQAVLDASPDFHRARLMVATTLLKQKRYEDALYAAQVVLDAEPENVQALRVASAANLALKRFDKADAYLQKAVEVAPNRPDMLLDSESLKLAIGDVAADEATLQEMLAQQPNNVRLRLYLASAAARKQDIPAALQYLKQGLNGTPTDAILLNMMGRLHLAHQEPQLAQTAFKRSLGLSPTFTAPYLNLARIALSQADYSTALQYFDAILAIDPANLTALINRARIHQANGEEAAALAALERARDTGHIDGFLALAGYQIKRQQDDAALRTLQEGQTRFPQNIALLNLEAVLFRRQNQRDKAFAVYQRIESLQEGRGSASALQMYLEAGEQAKAQEIAETALKTNPASAYSYLLAAAFEAATADRLKAIQILEKGLQNVQQPVPLYQRLVMLSIMTGKTTSASRYIQQWIDAAPKAYEAYFAQGILAQNQGDAVQAEKSYRTALEFNPQYAPALNNLAYLYTDTLGRPQEALPLAQKAVALNPGSYVVLDTLGYVLFHLEAYEEAKQIYLKALNLNPRNGILHFHLAQVLAETGEIDQAREMLQVALQQADESFRHEAEALLERL